MVAQRQYFGNNQICAATREGHVVHKPDTESLNELDQDEWRQTVKAPLRAGEIQFGEVGDARRSAYGMTAHHPHPAQLAANMHIDIERGMRGGNAHAIASHLGALVGFAGLHNFHIAIFIPRPGSRFQGNPENAAMIAPKRPHTKNEAMLDAALAKTLMDARPLRTALARNAPQALARFFEDPTAYGRLRTYVGAKSVKTNFTRVR